MLVNNNSSYDRDAVQIVLRNGKHLLAVINEILDLSKIESNNLKIELIETNLFQLIKEVENVMQLQAMEKGLEFSVLYEYPIPIFIQTDPTRLKQVLLNLCSNAIKFTEKGFVKIEIRFSAMDKNIDITVRDSGIGISSGQLERLFKPFTQADSATTRKFGGIGLGLYISREIVNKMGGDIYAESKLDSGTKLKFNINRGELKLLCLAQSIEDVSDYKQKNIELNVMPSLKGKILLAEDSEDNQALFSLFITAAGADVDIAVDGVEAVEFAKQGQYDLILMDMQMPRMDGLQATQEIIANGITLPIVALTANAMPEDRRAVRRRVVLVSYQNLLIEMNFIKCLVSICNAIKIRATLTKFILIMTWMRY